jgi:hypothetical protein
VFYVGLSKQLGKTIRALIVLTAHPNVRDEPFNIAIISPVILTKINHDLITGDRIRLARIIGYAFIFPSSDCCEGDVGRGKKVKKKDESTRKDSQPIFDPTIIAGLISARTQVYVGLSKQLGSSNRAFFRGIMSCRIKYQL